MADRNLAEQLDRVVEAIVAGPRVPRPAVDHDVRELAALAEELPFMPRQRFREDLKSQLIEAFRTRGASAQQQKETNMTTAAKTQPVRQGFHTVTPYPVVQGAARLMDFLKSAFAAEEKLRVPRPDGSIMHAEALIGDSIIEFADPSGQWKPMPGAFHLYMEDVDATYARALAAGGVSVHPLADHPYGERSGSVQDPLGNIWYIATYTAGKPGQLTPEGLRSLTPYLHPRSADGLIEFLRSAFGGELTGRYAAPDGRVMHAEVKIGDSVVEMGEFPGGRTIPAANHLYVPDCDAVYRSAVDAGANSIVAHRDEAYGDRFAAVEDPFGNLWYIATHIRDVAF